MDEDKHKTSHTPLTSTGNIAPPQSSESSTAFPSPSSEMQAKFYYAGLHSHPILVARSGTTPWEVPTGPEAHHKPKELRPVYNHPIGKAWEGDLGHKTKRPLGLDEGKLDQHRHRQNREPRRRASLPVVLWIGVQPGSLSGD
ncbi:hypothetical protein BJV74DRAFT_856616, partial [Russula compacta]